MSEFPLYLTLYPTPGYTGWASFGFFSEYYLFLGNRRDRFSINIMMIMVMMMTMTMTLMRVTTMMMMITI